jgi:flagellin-like hook-associated protein FlgL
MSDVAIASSMRANLLSLQKTNSMLDSTQLRLSTGRKVNSALDNAQSFFSAQGLTTRAGDLGRLLDSMGQSIQTIKQADTAVTSLTKLVEQADAITSKARDAAGKGTAEATVTGNVSLKGVSDIASLGGVDNGDTMTFKVVKADGTSPALQNSGAVTLSTNDSAEEVVAKINDLNQGLSSPVIQASLNDAGQLQIKGLDGASFSINFKGQNSGGEDTSENLNLAQSLGFGSIAKAVNDGTETAADVAQSDVKVTASASSSLTSVAMFNGSNLAKASDAILSLNKADGTTKIMEDGATAGDKIVVGYNDKTTSFAISATTSIQSLVDSINNDATLKGKVEASFDASSGKMNLRAVDASVESIAFGAEEQTEGEATVLNFGFGVEATLTATNADGSGTPNQISVVENVRLGGASGDLAQLEKDYEKVRGQIDALVADSGYRGTNLLKGDSMTTYFNEDRTTSLTSAGAAMTTAGLGMSKANFSSAGTIDAAGKETLKALDSVRNFSSALANDLTMLQNREDFTKATINTLNEGADKLTLADPNEEGARMLALQTRLQLGVTSLAMASQSQQSVLSLF